VTARRRWPASVGSGRGTAHFFLEWYGQAGAENVIGLIGLTDIKGYTGMGTHNATGLLTDGLRSGFGYFFRAASGYHAQEMGLRRAARRRRLRRSRSGMRTGVPLLPNLAYLCPRVRNADWTILARESTSNAECRAYNLAAVMNVQV
jgi:hypothetical protein